MFDVEFAQSDEEGSAEAHTETIQALLACVQNT